MEQFEQNARDWWDIISDAERESISKGLKDANGGWLRSHSEARAIVEEALCRSEELKNKPEIAITLEELDDRMKERFGWT